MNFKFKCVTFVSNEKYAYVLEKQQQKKKKNSYIHFEVYF